MSATFIEAAGWALAKKKHIRKYLDNSTKMFEPFRSVEQQLEILTRRLHWVEPNIVTAKAAL